MSVVIVGAVVVVVVVVDDVVDYQFEFVYVFVCWCLSFSWVFFTYTIYLNYLLFTSSAFGIIDVSLFPRAFFDFLLSAFLVIISVCLFSSLPCLFESQFSNFVLGHI